MSENRERYTLVGFGFDPEQVAMLEDYIAGVMRTLPELNNNRKYLVRATTERSPEQTESHVRLTWSLPTTPRTSALTKVVTEEERKYIEVQQYVHSTT